MPRTSRTSPPPSVFLQATAVVAFAFAQSVLAQQEAHSDVGVGSAQSVSPPVSQSSIFPANYSAFGSRSLSVPSGNFRPEKKNSSASLSRRFMTRPNQNGIATQLSSQSRIDLGSIQSKSSASEVLSSQRSTAQKGTVYQSRQSTISNSTELASASSAPRPTSHGTSLMKEVTSTSARLSSGHRAALVSSSAGSYASRPPLGPASGQRFNGEHTAGSSSGMVGAQGVRGALASPLHGPRLRKPGNSLRHTSHSPGAPSIR